MSVAVNRVMIAGNLGRDPESGETREGRPWVRLRVATNRSWRDPDGTRHEETDWHSVKVFGSPAEACRRFLRTGREVFVEGRLHHYSWEDQNKERRWSTEIVAHNVQFLGGSRGDRSPEDGSLPPPDSEAPLGVGGERPLF